MFKEDTDLGSGFRIAMKDLEIRGVGNLLGKKQYGHMEAVGYDLYCKMLNEAVKNLRFKRKMQHIVYCVAFFYVLIISELDMIT